MSLPLERLRRWIDVRALEAALPASPRVVVLVGRTSSGKTTLLNRLSEGARPTGLGGVTDEVAIVPDGAITWVDTPGIDDPDRAIDRLAPALDRAHGVLWVVDGLQPVTHTEREVVQLSAPEGLPMKVVVGRADLVGNEAASVCQRVQDLTGVPAVALDLRRDPLPEALRDWPPTPAEAMQLEGASMRVKRALEQLPGPVDPDHFREITDLRRPVKALLVDLERRQLNFPDLMVAWRDGLASIPAAAVVRWAADSQLGPHTMRLPELPPTPDPTVDALDVLRLSAAGAKNALKELRALSSSWLMEAQLVLADWSVPLDAEGAADLAQLREELRDLG